MKYPRSRAEVIEMLEQGGVMPTLQRIDIAHFLFTKPQHLSADAVFAGVNRDGEKVSKATVYNTLGLLVAKGIIREVLVDPGRVFYDSNLDPHFHIYNLDTGELSDVAAASLQLQSLPKLPKAVALDSLDVIIRVRNQAPA